jgi:hypothetical protein
MERRKTACMRSTLMSYLLEWDFFILLINAESKIADKDIASSAQSARCTIVIQLNLAAKTLRSRWRKKFINILIFELIASQVPKFGE